MDSALVRIVLRPRHDHQVVDAHRAIAKQVAPSSAAPSRPASRKSVPQVRRCSAWATPSLGPLTPVAFLERASATTAAADESGSGAMTGTFVLVASETSSTLDADADAGGEARVSVALEELPVSFRLGIGEATAALETVLLPCAAAAALGRLPLPSCCCQAMVSLPRFASSRLITTISVLTCGRTSPKDCTGGMSGWRTSPMDGAGCDSTVLLPFFDSEDSSWRKTPSAAGCNGLDASSVATAEVSETFGEACSREASTPTIPGAAASSAAATTPTCFPSSSPSQCASHLCPNR
mmetsp:Transcript_11285/g.21350  ORF Transcript_11285/g.21350 Transcript_11285/m.21350 type:complete len:294 (+) Transcript_11285:1118-1999(+)